ncbi:MAG: cystathionine gamma-synthase family protein [Maricaulaceae bacterium]|jgi:cystathionine gamma-synthase/methionine-gamma-lyase
MSKPDRPYRRRNIAGRALHPETLALSYGYDPHLSEGAIKPPIFQTSTFAFRSAEHGAAYFRFARGLAREGDIEDPGLAYTRINNPNLEVLEDRLTLYDETEEALAFSSGMGAITTSLLAYLDAGSVIVHSTPIYGATETFIRNTLPRFGVKTVEFFADAPEAEVRAAVEKARGLGELRVIYTETPSNPMNSLVDLELCARLRDETAEAQGVAPALMTDNTMLGPIGQTPSRLGVDLTIYSLTKYVGGHSDLVAGGVMGSSENIARVRALRTALGTVPDPHTCWLLLRSLETVKMRMERSFENARVCAEYLRDHPKIERVRFLGFLEPGTRDGDVFKRQCLSAGSTFAFEVAGGAEGAFRLLDNLKLIKLAVSLGGTESLMCHPASTTHSGVSEELRERLGYNAGLLRFSVGVEHPDDLIVDLEQALEAV